MEIRRLPWPIWDRTLEEFGNWLLVGSIASIGLPAIPGIVCLFVLLISFLAKEFEIPHEIERFNALKRKRETAGLNLEEQFLLSAYEAGELLHPPKRNTARYWIGFGFWTTSFIYLLLKMFFAHSLFF